MGLLDRYRRYDDLSPEERRRRAWERHREERRRADEATGSLDLSGTAPPTLPNPEVVNAAIAVARTGLHAYADVAADAPRRAIAERHGVDAAQVVVGNGAGELIRSAALALLGPSDELLTPWPSYPLYPELAAGSGALHIKVHLTDGAVDVDGLLSAVGKRTRVVVLCNPNDPTGSYLTAERIASLLDELPQRTWVLLDEALAHFQSVEPLDAALALVGRFPRLIVFRTLSKAYGLPGLRAGYAVGPRAATEMLASLGPTLGVNAVTQAALAYAIEHADYDVERRRQEVIKARRHLLDGVRRVPVEVSPSEASFIWLRAPAMTGADLAQRLERSGIVVATGETFGDANHVRIGVRDGAATRGVLAALESSVGPDGSSG
jgi:histidinol-phosphate aminotransferase